MKKSNWKLSYIHPWFFKKSFVKKSRNLVLSNFRNSTIIPKMIGLKASIYNGAWLLTKTFEEKMVGLKVGEFSITKKFDGQAQNKRKTKRKTKK